MPLHLRHDAARRLPALRLIAEIYIVPADLAGRTANGALPQHARNVARRLGRVGLSIGFRSFHVTRGSHRGRTVRHLDDCVLAEVSVLDYPAFDDAYVVPIAPGETTARAKMHARLALRAEIED